MTAEEGKTILIKPHHFLDIIKLYGSGLEEFIPDKEYSHDFWKVGNDILRNPNIEMELTLGADDICVPCKFIKNGLCSDMTDIDSGEISKDEWNKTIDRRLLEMLGLNEGDKITAIEYCNLASRIITREKILKVWKEKPVEITEKRVDLLLKGIEKYIKNVG
ncbi:MAG: DUF1284 domain-containing protein [Parcubacteria group bacterium]|jgi:hypothetical protein